jgi:F-type H+-transporting ATPase subunit alpha
MQLARGERLVEILKQPQYKPIPNEKQVLIVFAANTGYVDDYPVSSLARYEAGLYAFFDNRKPEILNDLREKKAIDDELRGRIISALDEFKKEFSA